jgi:mono/diheme cytochrome c family protein
MRFIAVSLMALTAIVVFSRCNNGKTDNGTDVPTERLVNGKKQYLVYCQSCHMQDGSGVPNLNAPLIGSKYVSGDTGKLIHIVLEGSAAFADEPNRRYGNQMASMAQVSDNDIADILTFLRNNFHNSGSAISADEVKAVRDKIK